MPQAAVALDGLKSGYVMGDAPTLMGDHPEAAAAWLHLLSHLLGKVRRPKSAEAESAEYLADLADLARSASHA
eukprot:8817107-Alexandrium_andersonii.AAC.1